MSRVISVLRWINQIARAGVQLARQRSGKYKGWVHIRVSNNAVKNIRSARLLREMGCSLQLLRVSRIVISDCQDVTSGD